LQFEFISLEKGLVTFYKNGSKDPYPLLFSLNNSAISLDSRFQLPVALQAYSNNDNEFVLHFNQLCRIDNVYFHFVVKGNSVTTTIEETSKKIKMNIPSSLK
jgi:hypothetical protein